MPPYFEGTEKKLEVALRPGSPSLRSYPEWFWDRIVCAVGARILSRIENDHAIAYLLSESSLFVYDDRMVMITCGRTQLTKAVPFLMERIGADAVELLAYERKNEVFPHAQATNFYEDAQSLRRHIPGRAFQFGFEDEHHLNVYQSLCNGPHIQEDVTVELLMYGLSDQARLPFIDGPSRPKNALEALGLRDFLTGFHCDEYDFEPSGYSLNAIREDRYFTVHVTPEERAPYASVETNADFDGRLSDVLRGWVDAFSPRSFDVVVWQRGRDIDLPDFGRPARNSVSQALPCGYHVRFIHYGRMLEGDRPAIELALEKKP